MTRYPYLPGTVPVVDPDAPGQRAARFLDEVQGRYGDRPRAPFAETWGQSHAGQRGIRIERENSTPMTLRKHWSSVTAVASGTCHCLAVRKGAVYAWGSNRLGQLGVGDTEDRRRPAAVAGLSDGVTDVSGSYTHSLAIRRGAVFAWGSNQCGQLGNGTTAPSSVPNPVPGLSDGVTAIAAGDFFSLAIRNGAVYAWGSNIRRKSRDRAAGGESDAGGRAGSDGWRDRHRRRRQPLSGDPAWRAVLVGRK